MRNKILIMTTGAALTLVACLVAPDEPSGTSADALNCAGTERAFNGACRTTCAGSAQCGAGTECMKVSADVSLCLDYKHCAYLGSDTTCSGVAAAPSYYDYGFQPYGYYGYGSSYGYGYGPPGVGGCAGNAKWQVIDPVGDPQCGAAHAVTRCAPVDGSCQLVSGSTVDVAEP